MRPIQSPAPLRQPPTRPHPAVLLPARITVPSIVGRSAAQAALHRSASTAARISESWSSRPVWDVSTGRASSGEITASQGSSGYGSGSGLQGNGNSEAGDEPCGFVTFSDPHGSHYDPQTRGFFVDIRMSVHFADGSSQSLILDYPWYYSSEGTNPWSAQNATNPNFPTRFQPPPTAKLADEPELVKYVAAHSTADGMTLLRDCADR